MARRTPDPLLSLAVALAGVLVAAPALASEGSEAAGFLGVPLIVWKLGNFLLFFGLLIYFLAKPMSVFFRTRGEAIAGKLAQAEQHKLEAARLQAETETRIAALSDEIQALREHLVREGERERAELERQGDAEAARFVAQVEAEATRRVVSARQQLAADAAQIAAELAVDLLKKELTAEDRERIFRTTLERLQVPGAGGER